MPHSMQLLSVLILGLLVGFLVGSFLKTDIPLNWQAVAAIGTLAAVIVALLPIYREWVSRRRRERRNQELTMGFLRSVHTAVRARVGNSGSPPVSEPLSEAETQLVIELGMRAAEVERLPRKHFRLLLSAVSGARMLAVLRLKPSESPVAFKEVAALLEDALSTLGYKS